MTWIVGAYIVGAGAREFVYRSDPQFVYQNIDRMPAILRGRIVLRDRTGGELAVPPSSLTVSVNARGHDSLKIQRDANVDEHGVFEVLGLPEGEASVAVRLGGGAVVWQLDGVAVGRAGVLDGRLDPIDLGQRLFPMRVAVIGPTGEPVPRGHIVWRSTQGASDDRSFEGDAPISDGVSEFLTTAPMIDVVTLVPGAAIELFEGLWGGERLDLAPGVTAVIRAEGRVPPPDDWTLRVVLLPVDLAPSLEYDGDSLLDPSALITAYENGMATLPLARGGRYRLDWWAVPTEGHRFDTLRISAEESIVDVPAGAGRHEISVPFPTDEFSRSAQAR